MGGGGQSTNTVQSATPWQGVQPGLLNLYGQGQNLFAQGGPQVFPGNPVSPMNGMQQNALTVLNNIGQNGSYGNLNPAQWQALGTTNSIVQGNDPLSQNLMMGANGTSTAAQGLTNIIGGRDNATQALARMLQPGYLNVNNNPALQGAMNAANYNTTFNFQNAVMPQLASQFSAAGRFGSGAQTQGINQATNNLASQISNTNAGMASSAFNQLLANQLGAAGTLGQLQGTASTQLGALQNNAAGLLNNRQGAALQLLPSMALQGIGNAQTAFGAGSQLQQQSQAQLSGQIAQFNQQQMLPYNTANWYAQLLAGGNPFASQASSGNVASQANPFTTALGTGLLGLGLSNAGAFSGIGGLLGGGAAMAAPLFTTGAAAGGAALMPSLLGGLGMAAMF